MSYESIDILVHGVRRGINKSLDLAGCRSLGQLKLIVTTFLLINVN